MFRITQVKVADVVYNAAVYFLRHIKIETTVASFHMKHGNFKTLGYNACNGTVCVSKNQNSIGLFAQEYLLGGDKNTAIDMADTGGVNIHEVIRLSDFQILEKNLIQFIVPVLTGVDYNMIEVLVKERHCTGETNNLGART